MSDFGAMAMIYRADGKAVGPNDQVRLQDAINVVRGKHLGEDSPLGCFKFNIGDAQRPKGGPGFFVGFSEYWGGHDDVKDGSDSGSLLARDRPYAERVSQEFQEILGADYQVECYCDWW